MDLLRLIGEGFSIESDKVFCFFVLEAEANVVASLRALHMASRSISSSSSSSSSLNAHGSSCNLVADGDATESWDEGFKSLSVEDL